MVRSHSRGPRSSNQKPTSPDTPPYWSRSPNPIGVSLRMNGRGLMRDASSVHRVLNGNVEWSQTPSWVRSQSTGPSSR